MALSGADRGSSGPPAARPAADGQQARAADGRPPGAAEPPAGPGGIRRRPAGLRLRWALPVAVAGGLALAAAFPPAGLWPLAAAGPALLAVVLWGRSLRGSFLVGLVFALAFFVPLISWLVNVAWYAWIALAIAEAVIFAVLAVGQRILLALRAWPVAAAGWWVAAEALRDRWPYAFPWGRLAMSQAGAPSAWWAAVGGAPLLSFVVALAGTTLGWLLISAINPRAARDGRPRPSRGPRAARSPLPASWPAPVRRLAIPALAFAAAAGLALAGPLLPVAGPAPGAPSPVIAAIQGDVPHARNLPDLLRASTVTANHARLTQVLAARVRAGTSPVPALVIWPENSTDLDPSQYPAVYQEILTAVDAIGRPVLVGAVLQNPQRNAGQLWLPGRGPVATYVKRQLVPFGEYIPLRGLLSHITQLVALQPYNFTPGHRAMVFHVGQIRAGDVICYEVGFDNLVRSEVTAGANLLTVQTNDATFEVDGQRGETLQQLAMARIRAVESDRSVVVASTTGVSAIIMPDGTIRARSGTWQAAVVEARVPLETRITLADRAGPWPERVITALAIAALLWAAGTAARRRHPRPASARDDGSPVAPLGGDRPVH